MGELSGSLRDNFTEIEKEPDRTWKSYFDILQDKADRGRIIIGVIHSKDRPVVAHGHIVALMPRSLCSGTRRQLSEWKEEDGVLLPCSLEAGGDVKEVKWFSFAAIDQIDAFKWYEYEE